MAEHGPGERDMTRVVQREVRRRGVFGWIFLLLFWAWNALMVWWLVSYWATVSPLVTSGSEAGRTGAAVGATLATGTIFFFWAAGAVIFGLLAFFTRGRRMLITETDAG